MSKLSTRQLEEARCICLARDGDRCALCHKPLSESKTVADVDHKDGDKENNPKNGSNWQLVHHSCNLVKWHFQKRMKLIDGETAPPFEYNISTKMELAWVRWMIERIERDGYVDYDVAIETGALEINANPVTTKRYLKKHLADPEHPKSLFKSTLDQFYDTRIVFTDVVAEYLQSNNDLI